MIELLFKETTLILPRRARSLLAVAVFLCALHARGAVQQAEDTCGPFTTALALAGSFEVRAQLVRGHFLQVLIVSHGSLPVLVTPHAILGTYLEVEIQDAAGLYLGHLGPLSTCPGPIESDFQVFSSDETTGSPVFGTELDLSMKDRFRLIAANGDETYDLEPGREYRLVVTYHNEDGRWLDARNRRILERRHPGVATPVLMLRAKPVPYRAAR
jgi:hypothetical protein